MKDKKACGCLYLEEGEITNDFLLKIDGTHYKFIRDIYGDNFIITSLKKFFQKNPVNEEVFRLQDDCRNILRTANENALRFMLDQLMQGKEVDINQIF
ncbi:hypothetical protein TVAGG3_0132840 [Trichomonas vaginalis G3]|uniref:hypothetical protein n=1 Tax=Trichomonas vaginalis (strain ATCC PRA-98 / G3) TaxID=412133 RepID=UPI0021E5524C|nr:hypothetical protein TVAGG3_0132840 [Trichomonas vaginalis G3]KAI5546206.1 hypothetical protein TVAGG3_0132840 [Trichomonas vaginalis G3]